MDKYAVLVPESDTKISEDLKVRAKCSRCSRPLEADTNVPKCPACGTLPAEEGE
jgi:Zn finger protein HypA/HybF involved in hydrogenase expression